MSQKNAQAQFQMLDSYIKEFNLNAFRKIDGKEELNIEGQVGFGIVSIREEKNKYIGQIELINDIKINDSKEQCAEIHIVITGLFSCNKNQDYDRNRFEGMLKINGATTLSHLIRAYVYTMTGLSGMPQITTPMINFVEFFNNAKKIKEGELK